MLGGAEIGKDAVSDIGDLAGLDVELLEGAIEDTGTGFPVADLTGSVVSVEELSDVLLFEDEVYGYGAIGDEAKFVMRFEGGEGFDDIFSEFSISTEAGFDIVTDHFCPLIEGF